MTTTPVKTILDEGALRAAQAARQKALKECRDPFCMDDHDRAFIEAYELNKPASPLADLIEALHAAKHALATCYEVAQSPADNSSYQDKVIDQIDAALSSFKTGDAPCPHCNGRGYFSEFIAEDKPGGITGCDDCGGTGKVAQPRTHVEPQHNETIKRIALGLCVAEGKNPDLTLGGDGQNYLWHEYVGRAQTLQAVLTSDPIGWNEAVDACIHNVNTHSGLWDQATIDAVAKNLLELKNAPTPSNPRPVSQEEGQADRPDWPEVYRDCAGPLEGEKAGDLVALTRETARLAEGVLRYYRSEVAAYHTHMAAEAEITEVLK